MRTKNSILILGISCIMAAAIPLTSCSNVNQPANISDAGVKVSISERKANLETALAEFIKTIPTVYPEILKLMDSKEITPENYEKFGEAGIRLSEKLGSKINEEQATDLSFINLFLDVYENKAQNEAAISKAR